MLKDFKSKSNQYRGLTVDSAIMGHVLKDGISATTNLEIKTMSRDQEI